MKMYTCIKSFKTAFFGDKTTERIEIKENTDWFFGRKRIRQQSGFM